MPYARVAAVTGANKGIGLAVVRNLALQYPRSPLNNGPLLVYLTARDQSRGEDALKNLHNDPQLRHAKALAADGGQTTLAYHQLDISDTKSIHQFAAFLGKEHPEGIDVLINKYTLAGIAMSGFDNNVVNQTLHTNYYGTLEATEQILPLIKDGGRLINVASMTGKLSKYSNNLRQSFLDAKTVPQVNSLMEDFKESVKKGNDEEKGWIRAAYSVSKAGVIGMTRAIAMRQQQKGSKTLINSCCPGYVATDMTKQGGHKTPDEGAQTPVLLGIGDIGQQSGLFWQSEKPIDW